MTQKELQKLVKFCREQGILNLKMKDVEITIASQAIFPEKPAKEIKPEEKTPPQPVYDEMQTLLWSVQGADEQQTEIQ